MRNSVWIILLLMLLSCNNDHLNKAGSNNPVEIIIDDGDNLVDVSELFDRVEFIPLQSNEESFFDAIYAIKIVNGDFYIQDQNERILIYDRKGFYKSKVDFRGHGPGEYIRINSFFVDKDQNIYTYDNQGSSIHKYDADCNYKSSFNIPSPGGIQFGVIDPELPTFIFTTNYNLYYNQSVGDYNALTVANGSILNGYLPFTLPQPTKSFNPRQRLNYFDPLGVYEFHDSINVHLPFSDTVFYFKDDSMIPKYVIDFGDEFIPIKKILESDLKSTREFIETIQKYNRGPYFFNESESFVFFKFHLKQQYLCCIFNKTNNKTHQFSVQPDQIDLPFFYNPVYLSDDCLFFHYEPISILQFIEKSKTADPDIIDTIDSQYPGFKEMVGNLKDDGNAIIIKASLKH